MSARRRAAAFLVVLSVAGAADWRGEECMPSQLLPAAECSVARCGFGSRQPACALFARGVFTTPPSASLPALAVGVESLCSYADGELVGSAWTSACNHSSSYTPGELRLLLQGRRLEFSGDSMVRQLFNRLICFLRGQQYCVDPWFHWNASYSLNLTHDAYGAPEEEGASSPRVDAPLFEARFVWDPEWSHNGSSAGAGGAPLTLRIGSPMYWVHHEAARVIDALLAAPAALALSTPPHGADEAAHRARNAHLAKHARGRYLPLAEMAAAAEWGRLSEVHFQCQALSPVSTAAGEVGEVGDGSDGCFDAVNLNAVFMLADWLRRHP